jgi:hypothetical protein
LDEERRALYDVIKASQTVGHIFVAIAHNRKYSDQLNNDNVVDTIYPASYDLPNIIAVAAPDNDDSLWEGSHYGAKTVDLAAPGVHIWGPWWRGDPNRPDYLFANGTSVAGPYVTGIVALVMSRSYPNWRDWQDVRDRVLWTARKIDCDPGPDCIKGKTLTGGVVNALKAVWDCNENNKRDACDMNCAVGDCQPPCGGSEDCTDNGIPDECEPDCNNNGVADSCDIAAGVAFDCDRNARLDECEGVVHTDCNANLIPDMCEIADGFACDLDGDGVPDDCVACCEGGTCSNRPPEDCANSGGVTAGTSGGPCDGDSCVSWACCDKTACAVKLVAQCKAEGGYPRTDSSSCDSNPCASGVCCTTWPDCDPTSDPLACNADSAWYVGGAATCSPNPCPMHNHLFVTVNGASSSDCSGWGLSCKLQRALSLAEPGDEIWVRAGTYMPDGGAVATDLTYYPGTKNRAATFQLPNGVHIYGGFNYGRNERASCFVGQGTSIARCWDVGAACGDEGRGICRDVRRACVSSGATFNGKPCSHRDECGTNTSRQCPDGLTVLTGDLASDDVQDMDDFLACFSGDQNPYPDGCGSFDLDIDGDVDAEDGHIDDNSYHVVSALEACSKTVLDRFTITRGMADDAVSGEESGAGAYLIRGAPTLNDCTVSENISGCRGGGLFSFYGSPHIANCEFKGNKAEASGGGVATTGATPTFLNCTFDGNTASDGGGVANSGGAATLINCVFADNSADWYGGGFHNVGDAPTLTNCTFYANSAGDGCGGGLNSDGLGIPTITNCIFWGNTAGDGDTAQLRTYPDSPVTFSCIQDDEANDGVVYPGTGNIDSDPSFRDTDGRLTGGDSPSPCIDSGSNDYVPSNVTTDRDGMWRKKDHPNAVDCSQFPVPERSICGSPPVVDMGAYEHQGSVLFVDAGMVGGVASNGSDWGSAYGNLQTALAAAVPGEQIWVAEGVYRPDEHCTPSCDRTATFELKSGVQVLGGFQSGDDDVGDRDPAAHATVLSGDLNDDDDPADFPNGPTFSDNSYHVVYAVGVDSTAVLDGFRIEGGNADDDGGGMFIDGGPSVVNCTFIGNAAHSGGGLYTNIASTPALTNCAFIGNSAVYSGGGMFNFYSNPSVVNGLFTGNVADFGAGIYDRNATLELTNCTLHGNSATSDGGGVYNVTTNLTLNNSVLWGNTDIGGADESAQIYGATVLVDHCCVQGWTGGLGGTGNIGSNPQFVDADGPDGLIGTEDDNLHVIGSSPCIDSGNSTLLPPDGADLDNDGDTDETIPFDLEGNQRVVNGTAVDMGVYEFPCPGVAAPATPTGEAGYAKNRYVSFFPGNAGQTVAFRVTLVDLPPPFESFEGCRLWVGPPFDVSELSGSLTLPPTFKAANLTTTPHYRDWGSIDSLHVFGADAVPSKKVAGSPPTYYWSTYEIQAIHQDCDLEVEEDYSAPLAVTMSLWGDIVSDCGVPPPAPPCGPPNGAVDFSDISAVVDKFRNLPASPKKSRADIAPNSAPNKKVDFEDIASVDDAFKGKPYPFTGPVLCPAP